MVRACFNDRIQVQRAYAKRLEIWQLFRYALERAAVKIIGGVVLLAGARLPFDRLGYAAVHFRRLPEAAVIFNACLRSAVVGKAEAVGEDLIHDAAAEFLRRFEAALIHREAKTLAA